MRRLCSPSGGCWMTVSNSNSSNNRSRSLTKSGMDLMAKGTAKGFASTTDMAEKKITFSEIGTDLYAFTAEGNPNSAVIVGDDGCVGFDAQSMPGMAHKAMEQVRSV